MRVAVSWFLRRIWQKMYRSGSWEKGLETWWLSGLTRLLIQYSHCPTCNTSMSGSRCQTLSTGMQPTWKKKVAQRPVDALPRPSFRVKEACLSHTRKPPASTNQDVRDRISWPRGHVQEQCGLKRNIRFLFRDFSEEREIKVNHSEYYTWTLYHLY